MALTVEEVKSKFRYEPETGHIYWVKLGKGKIKKKPAGTKVSSGYIGICVGDKRYFAHRLAWVLHYGFWPNEQIDHINGDKADNRISNLREATNSQNGKNYGFNTRNTSGVKGVSFCKSTGRWRAIIKVNHKSKCLGRYDTKENAARARQIAEEKYFGEWRRA